MDPVIEAYKQDVDRTLVRAMLDLTPEERTLALQRALADATDLREAMAAASARTNDAVIKGPHPSQPAPAAAPV